MLGRPLATFDAAEYGAYLWAGNFLVTHPELRVHLSFGCQGAGEAALSFVGEDGLTFWGREGEGCSVIGAWDETQNQIEVGAFQLAGALAAVGSRS